MPKKGKVRLLFDGKDATGVTWKKEANNYILELNLVKDHSFNVCSLQENISKGQRVEKFVLEGWQNNQWVKITEGTTIGYRRLLKFENFTTSKLRLVILSSRLQPTIAEVGLYEGSSE